MNMDELKKSYERFGAIYPILVDKNGKPIDGFHRIKVDKNWPTMKIDTDDDVKKLMIALVANVQRREIKADEITKRLDAIAELTGWKPKQIAEETGLKHNWILLHISDGFKDQEMSSLRKDNLPVTEGVTIPDSVFNEPYEPIESEESTITPEEMNEIEPQRIMISLPGNIYNLFERESKKAGIEMRVFIARIVLKWAKRRGELWNKK